MAADPERASPPIIFSLPGHGRLLPRELNEHSAPSLGRCECARFPSAELDVGGGSPVERSVCAVLGSLAPPDEQIVSVLLLAHTLKREGAQRVIALLPYL